MEKLISKFNILTRRAYYFFRYKHSEEILACKVPKKLGSKGLTLIKHFEGFYSKPYLCPAGVATVGYGTTYYANGRRVTLHDPYITEQEASRLLADTLTSYEKAVDGYCTDTLNQNQFDALTSFCYNLGSGNLKVSTLLKKVNKDVNDPTIRLEFMKWTRANGKILKGLVTRRAAEADLYFTTP